ncbi:MAG: methyltransferase [Bacilli bacterium]|nr:methyltransferase [Bacilli bacterium]
MKIELSQIDKIEFEKLLKIKDDNIEISDLLLSSFQYTDFIDVDDLKTRVLNGESEEDAIKKIILEAFEVNDKKFKTQFLSQVSIKKCIPSNYLNAYAKILSDVKISFGNYKLKTITYEPYQLFALDDIDVESDYKEVSRAGYFDQKFTYPALFEGKDLWMSLNPNEITTMDNSIKSAKGNVLVLGLGMGYITYMMSQKSNVKTITVVEKNKENIKLFKKFLLPKFENKTKIRIVNDDAISYIVRNNKFDYIYADLWFNPEDGLEYYLRLNKIELENDIEIDYWLETSLKQMKRRYLIELIKEQLEGVGPEAYQSEEELPDRIFKILYKETKDLTIKNIKDIRKLLA